ncbi:Uncharacterised protein [Mycobacteroides abscessus subsp. abscessus]|nr:Uncharacterised protein [Mycobacteroides abscessus subsp. abscessus]
MIVLIRSPNVPWSSAGMPRRLQITAIGRGVA